MTPPPFTRRSFLQIGMVATGAFLYPPAIRSSPLSLLKKASQEKQGASIVKVVGVGDGGCSAVARMADCAVPNVEFIYANADVSELAGGRTHQVIQLHSLSQRASDAAEDDRTETEAEVCVDSIRRAVAGARLLFVVAGMGGETGTKAAPVIARIAKEMGILTVAVVTKPFEWEGTRRLINAERGLAELKVSVDPLFLVRCEIPFDASHDITQYEAFALVDEMLSDVVGGILDMAQEPGNEHRELACVQRQNRQFIPRGIPFPAPVAFVDALAHDE